MATDSPPPPAGPPPERRTFLRWLTYGLGAVATAAVGIPFVGYLLGARKALPEGWTTVTVAQGAEIGRPSRLEVHARVAGGATV